MLNYYKRFTTFLYKNDHLSKKINKSIQKLKLAKIKKLKIQDPEELYKWSVPFNRWNSIYDQLKQPPEQFAAYLGLTFSLRQGEVAHLRLPNIILDDSDSNIKVIGDFSGVDPWEPKTPSSTRKLPITDRQKPVIQRYLVKRKTELEYKFGKNYQDHGYVVYSPKKGSPVKYGLIWNWMQKVSLKFTEEGKTFIRLLRPHVCRYSSAVYYWETSRDILGLSKWLGHASIRDTEKYLALTPQQTYDNLKLMLKKSKL